MKRRIALHSVPRSGSTWLGSILDSHPRIIYKYQPLFSYAMKGYLTPHSGLPDILSFFNKLESLEDPFLDQTDAKKKGIVPVFNKDEIEAISYKEVRYHHLLENMLEKDKELKVIGLVRNPLSMIYSWLNAPKEFRSDLGWKIEEEWRFAPLKNLEKKEEFNGYEKWKEVALLFEKLRVSFPQNFYLIRYSDLLKDTELSVKTLFEFLGLSYNKQTQHFIKESKEKFVNDAYSVYKIKQEDDKWKKGLPHLIIDFILKDLKNTSLEKYIIE